MPKCENCNIFLYYDSNLCKKCSHIPNLDKSIKIKTFIYVLKLKGGHYYVGSTKNPKSRLKQHINGKASSWTQLHSLISDKYSELYECNSVPGLEEDKKTKELMIKYGIEKVRGGSYSMIELTNNQVQELNRTLWHANNKCTKCGRTGHWANKCYAKKDTCGNFIEEEYESEEEYIIEYDMYLKKDNSCFRCGRTGHWTNKCYANKDIYGNVLENDTDSDTEPDVQYRPPLPRSRVRSGRTISGWRASRA